MSGRKAQNRPLAPRTGFVAVSPSWDWTDSPAAVSWLWSPFQTLVEAQQDREYSRQVGAGQERIVKVTTTIEIVDEGRNGVPGQEEK